MFGFAARSNPYKPFFCVVGGARPGQAVHVAFAASSREQVDAFHAAALQAGGTCNGPPGIRRYHEAYYGAFVRDPDGVNVEAVCHAPA
jgi:catechol 2,3-dioxygenase-like lactoylglutathione lyase family enzyme